MQQCHQAVAPDAIKHLTWGLLFIVLQGYHSHVPAAYALALPTQRPCILQLPVLCCCQQAEAGPLEVEEANDAELEQPEIEQVWTIKARALPL